MTSHRQVPLTGLLSHRKLPVRLAGTKHQVRSVLVPADTATHVSRKNKDSRPQPGQSRGLAGVLLSAIRVWERQEQQKIPAEELLAQAAVRSEQVSDRKQFMKCWLLCMFMAVWLDTLPPNNPSVVLLE